MNDPGAGAPNPEGTFEALEAELQRTIGQLEDAAVPLEKRMQLHSRAVRRLRGVLSARLGPADRVRARTEEAVTG